MTWALREKSGFTLMEMLVGILIFSIISIIVLLFFVQSSNLWQTLTTQSDLRSTARNAVNFMCQELRNATRTSSSNPSPNISIPPAPNNNSIDFYLPFDKDGNGLIIDALGNTEWNTADKIQYQYVPAQKQLRRLENGNPFIVANEVSKIEFEDNSINSSLYINELRINLTLERTIPMNKKVSVTVASIVKLRN